MRPLLAWIALFVACGPPAAPLAAVVAGTSGPKSEGATSTNRTIAIDTADSGVAWVNADETHVYWSQDKKLLRARHDGSDVEAFAPLEQGSQVRLHGGDVYWLDYRKAGHLLLRKPKNGGPEVMVTRQAPGVTRLAVDDSGVYTCGGSVGRVVNERVGPLAKESCSDIALDGEHVYFATNRSIMRVAKVDGAVQEIVAAAPSVGAIAVDERNVYWTSTDDHTLRSVAKSGGEVIVLAQNATGAVEVVEDSLVFGTTLTTGGIALMPKRGGAVRTVDIGWGSPSSIATARGRIFAGCGAVLRNVDPSGDLRVPPIPTCPTVATEHAGRPEIVTRSTADVYSVAVDDTHIYYAAGASDGYGLERGFVFRVSKKDGAQTTLAKDLVFPSHLTVGGDAVFFTQEVRGSPERVTFELSSVPKTGGAVTTMTHRIEMPEDVAFDGDFVYWGSHPSDDVVGWIGRVGDLRRAPEKIASGFRRLASVAVDAHYAYGIAGAGIVFRVSKTGGDLVPLGANRNARVLASDRDDLFWSAGERVFRLSKQGGPSLPIGSARAGTRITRLLVDEKTIYAAVADNDFATPKQIVAFPKTGGCATVVYGGSESNHQAVQPHAIDDEYIYGVTRNEVVRISKVR